MLPTGIATDTTTAPFFSDLVRNSKLVSFLDFENEAFLLSHAVHHWVRFCLLTVCGSATRVNLASFAFGTRYMQDLPARRFAMPPEEILFVNPNTGTTPVFRSRRDAEITIGIYKRVPVLWRKEPEENPWGLSFLRMIDMSNDSELFRTREDLIADSWHLDGNVFVRAASGCCRFMRRRWFTTSTTDSEAMTARPRPRPNGYATPADRKSACRPHVLANAPLLGRRV